MEDVFGNAEVVKKDKGYYILRSEKIWDSWFNWKERDGGELSTEISYLINGYVSGKIPDYRMATGDGNYQVCLLVKSIDLTTDIVPGEQYDLSAIWVLR